ncbi:MAG: hypothetical protein AB7V36_09485 [Bacteroidales bacterium]
MAKGYKTGGREQGTPNKTTAEVRDRIQMAISFIDGDAEKFKQDIEALTPAERLKFYTSLIEYVQPKLSRVEAQVEQTSNKGMLCIVAPTPEEENIIKRLQSLNDTEA